MDSIVKEPRAHADDRFDTARITAAINALADQHAGREDIFRAAMAQLLKAEMIKARAEAQAILLQDRHGRRCAERLCFMQDEIIRILYAAATRHLYRSPIPTGAERMAVVATGGYGRGLMAPNPTSIFCSSCPTSRPPGASRSRKRFYTVYGIWA